MLGIYPSSSCDNDPMKGTQMLFIGGKGLFPEHQTPRTHFIFKSSSAPFLPLSLLQAEQILWEADISIIHTARLKHPRMTSFTSLHLPLGYGLPLNILAMHYILEVNENCHFAFSVLPGFPSLVHSRSLIQTSIIPKVATVQS